MLRRSIIACLMLAVAALLLVGTVSLRQTVSVCRDLPWLGWTRVSISRGIIQFVSIAPRPQGQPGPDDSIVKFDLDAELHLRVWNISRFAMDRNAAGNVSSMGRGLLELSAVEKGWRFCGLAFGTCRPTGIKSIDWTHPSKLTVIMPLAGGWGPIRIIAVAIPLWAPLALLLFYPFATVLCGPVRRRFIRRYRRKHGLCVECRYDLTGNESGVCPECGTAVGKTPGADGA